MLDQARALAALAALAARLGLIDRRFSFNNSRTQGDES
jgi:hypothetical protein